MSVAEPEEREVVISGQERKLNSPEDVEDTVRAINEEEGLTTLRLSGNSMGVQAAQEIAGALASRPSFRRALWKDMFVGRGKSEIPPALTTLSDAVMAARAQLVELDLSDNAFGPAGIEAIFQLLSGPACFSLRILKLNNTGMGPQGGELLAEALGQCHSEASRQGGRLQLEVFVVGRSRLENPGASALAEVFAQLGSLREVAMPQNGINKDGISALASAFAKNTELRVS
jgi:Ran GTPase-activating protein 1